jgi:hypothetical protein
MDRAHTDNMTRINGVIERGNLDEISDALSNPRTTLPNDETLYREEGALIIATSQETQAKLAKRFVENLAKATQDDAKAYKRSTYLAVSSAIAVLSIPISVLIFGSSAFIPSFAVFGATVLGLGLSANSILRNRERAAQSIVSSHVKSQELLSRNDITDAARSELRRVESVISSETDPITRFELLNRSLDPERREHADLRRLLEVNPNPQPQEIKI